MEILDKTGVSIMWDVIKEKYALKSSLDSYLTKTTAASTYATKTELGEYLPLTLSGDTTINVNNACLLIKNNDKLTNTKIAQNQYRQDYYETATGPVYRSWIQHGCYVNGYNTIPDNIDSSTPDCQASIRALWYTDAPNEVFPSLALKSKIDGKLKEIATVSVNRHTKIGGEDCYLTGINIHDDLLDQSKNNYIGINITSKTTKDILSASCTTYHVGLTSDSAEYTSVAPLGSDGKVPSQYVDTSSAELPVGTILTSYDNTNIFGDSFIEEDGGYYKKSEVSLNLGDIYKITPIYTNVDWSIIVNNIKYTLSAEYLVYFNGYYYCCTSDTYWGRSTTAGNFTHYGELDGMSHYIGDGAFTDSSNKNIYIIGGTTYNNNSAVTAYSDGFFLDQSGITKDFNKYISMEITSKYELCMNRYDYIYNLENNTLTIYKISVARSVASISSSDLNYIYKLYYSPDKNFAVYSYMEDSDYYFSKIDFNKGTITTLASSSISYDFNIIEDNLFIIRTTSTGRRIMYIDNRDVSYYDSKLLTQYYSKLCVVNDTLYIIGMQSTSSYKNDSFVAVTGLYSSDLYYQVKTDKGKFVKIK